MTDAVSNQSEVAFKKSSPQNFTESERRSIVQLYDLFDCKATSMSVIHSIDGYETIPERKVKRWKIGIEEIVPRVPGKPISLEFEQEVMMECQKTDSKEFKKSSATNGYTYSLVRLCALQVMNRDYWDADSSSFVQKWRRDKRTCGLLFTNKWVSGVLRRWKEYCLSKADKRPTGTCAVAELPTGTAPRAAAAHDDSRPVEEFEADVVAECVRCGVAAASSFASSMVAECANKVLHAEYWDDRSASHTKKWLLQERIRGMQFTRDWIADILRRAVQQQLCTQFHEAEAVDTHVPGGKGPPHLSQSELNRYFDIDEDSWDGHYYMLIGLITG